jgi:carbon monoxide dehydrogenase subunit G
MAMTMTGEVQLPANREAVWAKLNDPTVLKSCIPGFEMLEMNGRTVRPRDGQGRARQAR